MATPNPLLRLVLEQNKDFALILLDENGKIVSWLMGATRMFGYNSEEMLGQAVDRLFTPEDCDRGVPKSELEMSAKFGRGEDDRWLIRKDGVRLWVSGVLTCLKDREGRIAGFSKILSDRTDLKERFDLLHNRSHALEAENRQKIIMLGMLAHELRNPLGVLSNAAQLFEMAHPQNQELVSTAQIISRQVKYMKTLVEDLLENTRLQTGKVALHMGLTDLHTLLIDALESASASIHEKRQKVELLMPQNPITLNADPMRLKQVFVNLISNASKFSDDEATIWVRALTEDEDIVVRVEDRGRGIPAELLPRLFELFSQGEVDRDYLGLGLGLGLAIVKQYVELHGGNVQARSDGVGRGSEFIVRLPLAPNGSGPSGKAT